jgi:hypothetical protein
MKEEEDLLKPLSAKVQRKQYTISGKEITNPKTRRNAADKSLVAALKKKAKAMKTFPDLMVDLETYGTAPGCVILEVALVAFDRNSDRRIAYDSFFPDITEQQSMGFTIDNETMKFWADNQEAWTNQLQAMREPVATVVGRINAFWNDHCHVDKTVVWAKGTPFDFPILRTILKDPWSFRNIHDMRTLKFVSKSDIVVKSTKPHFGLMDAIAQAQEVRQICSTIGTGF